jgi:hypothetical protein
VSIRDLAFPDPEKSNWKDQTPVGLELNQCIRLPSENAAITPADMRRIQQAIEYEVFCVYQKMKNLGKKR